MGAVIYVIGGMAIVIALLGFGVDHYRSAARVAESETEVCEAKLETQNESVKNTKAAGDRMVAAAVKGVATAAMTTQAQRTEAERLRGLTGDKGQPAKPGACPAGDAVIELRKGLKP